MIWQVGNDDRLGLFNRFDYRKLKFDCITDFHHHESNFKWKKMTDCATVTGED